MAEALKQSVATQDFEQLERLLEPVRKATEQSQLAAELLLVDRPHRHEEEVRREDVASGDVVEQAPEERDVLRREGVTLARARRAERADDRAVAEEDRCFVCVHGQLRPMGHGLIGVLVDDQGFLRVRALDQHLLNALLNEIEDAHRLSSDSVPSRGIHTGRGPLSRRQQA